MLKDDRHLWSFGSGKGGVGKTLLTASTGLLLARMGYSVTLIDAALGAPNLHITLGIRSPKHTLLDVFENRVSEEEILIPTSEPRLRLLCCTADTFGASDPSPEQRQKTLEFVSGLSADFVLLDAGPGQTYQTLDFFNLSAHGVVVATPDPASMQNAYAFIKNAVYRRIQMKFGNSLSVQEAFNHMRAGARRSGPYTMMDFYDHLCVSEPETAESVATLIDHHHPLLVVNKAASDEDKRVAEVIQTTCKKYLNVDIRLAGIIFADSSVQKASQKMMPLNLSDEAGTFTQQLRPVVLSLLSCSGKRLRNAGGATEACPSTSPIMGLNDNLDVKGNIFHIQTEDLGYVGRCIATQVFYNGQVVLSTRTEYPASVSDSRDRTMIEDLMRNQHLNVLHELEARKDRILQPIPPR